MLNDGRKGGSRHWTWSKNAAGLIKAGDHWTMSAVECYLEADCKRCVYLRYCKQRPINGRYIMKYVIDELQKNVGDPPNELIDKIMNGDYN